jgi:hypothetical protein
MLSRRLGSFDHTSSTSWRHQQWPFGQDGEEFKEDSLGIKGDEVENFQNCLLVSLFLLMKYGCHVQVGVESFCVNDFPIRAVIFFTLALGIVETLQKKILSHTVCCESMFPTSSNIIFVSCFFQKDNMALWV